jgi:hypothetical protein
LPLRLWTYGDVVECDYVAIGERVQPTAPSGSLNEPALGTH